MLSLLLCMGLAAQAQPNVLIVVADDIGTEWIEAYGEGFEGASTPNIDALAGEGLLFRRAYAGPSCSPGRALLQTGRYGFRNGVGTNVKALESTGGMYEASGLPSFVGKGYRTGWRGKWHLSDKSQGLDHALGLGWETQWGTRANLGQSALSGIECSIPLNYSKHVELRDGAEACVTEYATVHTTDTAVDLIAEWGRDPWVLVVSYNAAHAPHHEPPEALCPDACPLPGFFFTDQDKMRAMTESLDSEVGRLLQAVPETTYVIFTSDNGTAPDVALGQPGSCGGEDKVKGTLFEGGTRVPFIVVGPRVPKGIETNNLVQLTDVAATVAEITGGTCRAEDSISFLSYLQGAPAPQRSWVFTEKFSDNGDAQGSEEWTQAIRDEEWKLIRHFELGQLQEEELYSLTQDPCEQVNLIQQAREIPEYQQLGEILTELTGT